MYVGTLYCLAEMFASRVAWCPLVSRGEHADWTDRRTLSATRSQRHKELEHVVESVIDI